MTCNIPYNMYRNMESDLRCFWANTGLSRLQTPGAKSVTLTSPHSVYAVGKTGDLSNIITDRCFICRDELLLLLFIFEH